jgi:hypothetical protein
MLTVFITPPVYNALLITRPTATYKVTLSTKLVILAVGMKTLSSSTGSPMGTPHSLKYDSGISSNPTYMNHRLHPGARPTR